MHKIDLEALERVKAIYEKLGLVPQDFNQALLWVRDEKPFNQR